MQINFQLLRRGWLQSREQKSVQSPLPTSPLLPRFVSFNQEQHVIIHTKYFHISSLQDIAIVQQKRQQENRSGISEYSRGPASISKDSQRLRYQYLLLTVCLQCSPTLPHQEIKQKLPTTVQKRKSIIILYPLNTKCWL